MPDTRHPRSRARAGTHLFPPQPEKLHKTHLLLLPFPRRAASAGHAAPAGRGLRQDRRGREYVSPIFPFPPSSSFRRRPGRIRGSNRRKLRFAGVRGGSVSYDVLASFFVQSSGLKGKCEGTRIPRCRPSLSHLAHEHTCTRTSCLRHSSTSVALSQADRTDTFPFFLSKDPLS